MMFPKTHDLLVDLQQWHPEAKVVMLQTVPDQGLGKYPCEPAWNVKSEEASKRACDFPSLRKLSYAINRWSLARKNVALITGETSGVLVIDVDNKGYGLSDFTHILREMGYNSIDHYIQTSKIPCVKTPSKGYHFYYKYREGKYKQNFGFTTGKYEIDIQGNNKCVVYPGSVYQGCKPKYELNEKREPKRDKTNNWILNTEPHKCGASTFDECIFRGSCYEWINRPTNRNDLLCLPDVMYRYFTKDESVLQVSKYDESELQFELNEQVITSLIEILRPRACMGYNDWSGTILALTSVGATREQIHQWSSYAESGYDEKRTDSIIDGYLPNGKSSLGSIRKWCREYISDEEFSTLFQSLEKSVEQSLMYLEDRGLAELFWIHTKDELKVAKLDDDKIFRLNKSIMLWEAITKSECCSYIGDVLSKICPRAIIPLQKQLYQLKKQHDDDELDTKEYINKTTPIESKLKQLSGISKSVNRTSKQQSIFAQAKVKLYDKDFLDKLNMSREEIAIQPRKILNLRTLELRDRTPIDYFSIENPVDYIEETPQTQSKFQVAREYLMSLCNKNSSLYDCLTQMCGYFITRENSDRRVYVWYGDGSNGKSSLVNCLETIIGVGAYGIKTADATLVIEDKNGRKKTAGSCSPELLALKYARTALISETKDDDYLNEIILKQITGGDTIQARGLFESEDENFKINTKVFILTNNRPKFTPSKSMHKRLLLFPFNASFEETTQNKVYIETIKTEYLSYLFSLFARAGSSIYKDKILKIADTVEESTKEYLSDNDILKQYIDRNLLYYTKEEVERWCKEHNKMEEYKATDLKPIKLSDLYDDYKRYYKEEIGTDIRDSNKKKFNLDLSKVFPNTVVYDKNNRLFRGVFFRHQLTDLFE